MNIHNISLRKSVHASKRGQTLVEYGMVLALISVVAIGVMAATGGQIGGVFSTVSSQLSVANGGGTSSGTGGTGGSGNGSGGSGGSSGGSSGSSGTPHPRG